MNNIMICLSYVVTMLPMIFGLAKWKSLPDEMAIHFAANGTPNGYAPKIVAVVVVPVILLVVQLICVTSLKRSNADTASLIRIIQTWLIPIVSIAVAFVIYRFALK